MIFHLVGTSNTYCTNEENRLLNFLHADTNYSRCKLSNIASASSNQILKTIVLYH